MARQVETLFVGTGRYVIAVRADSGTEAWRTKLPSSASSIVSLMVSGDRLFVGHAGRVYCLSAETGAIQWDNGLPRTGFGPVMMVAPGVAATFGAMIAAAQVAADAAAHASAGC